MDHIKNTDDLNKVFVYGTLKKGHGNHHILEGDVFLGKAYTVDNFSLHNLGAFPCMSYKPLYSVQGELYEVSDVTKKRIDRLEGHPDFYHRRIIFVTDEEGKIHPAWAYFIQHPRAPVMEENVWNEG